VLTGPWVEKIFGAPLRPTSEGARCVTRVYHPLARLIYVTLYHRHECAGEGLIGPPHISARPFRRSVNAGHWRVGHPKRVGEVAGEDVFECRRRVGSLGPRDAQRIVDRKETDAFSL
jgi:hypothetical protein